MMLVLKYHLVRTRMRTPRAAAIAGIVFAVLLIPSLWLLRLSTPANPLEVGSWLSESSEQVNLALNLIPFAGVAFMWFLGVLRDRLGPREDKFFATVFLGSGLMFCMLFVAARWEVDLSGPIRPQLRWRLTTPHSYLHAHSATM